MGGFSVWHWLIVLVVVVLVFGTKKLGSVGKDLGDAVKGFKDGVKGGDSGDEKTPSTLDKTTTGNATIDVDAKEKTKN